MNTSLHSTTDAGARSTAADGTTRAGRTNGPSRLLTACTLSATSLLLPTTPTATALAAAACTIEGVSGTDIVGTPGPDVICGADGTYTINAGDGDDIVRVAPGAIVTVFLGAGNDTFEASPGAQVTVDGGTGNDTVDGEDAASLTVTLGPGNDVFDGDGADDADGASVDGGTGNDRITGTPGPDDLDGADGADIIDGGDGNDVLDGGAGNDAVTGSPGNDTITGGDGTDELWGLAGTDTVTGGPGDDIVSGGDGVDVLDGGFGLNMCDYTATEPRTTTCTYDDTAPVIVSTSWAPASVEVGATAATSTLTIRLTDQMAVKSFSVSCGVIANDRFFASALLNFWFPSPGAQPMVMGNGMRLDARLVDWSGTARDLTARVEATVPFATYPGVHSCHATAFDWLDQERFGAVTSLGVTRTGTGFDDDGPVVQSLALAPDTVEVGTEGATTTMTVRVTDETGLESVAVTCSMLVGNSSETATGFLVSFPDPSGDPQVSGGDIGSPQPRLLEWSGTPTDLTVIVESPVAFGQRPGRYRCGWTAEDVVGNRRQPVELDSFLVVTRSGPGFDDDGPAVPEFSWSPSSVEVGAGGATTTLAMQVTDDSGFTTLDVACTFYGNGRTDMLLLFNLRFQTTLEESGPTTTLQMYSSPAGSSAARLVEWSGDRRDLQATIEVAVPFGQFPNLYACVFSGQDLIGNNANQVPLASLNVTRTPPGQPTAPTGLEFVASSPSKGTLSWVAPAVLGDPVLKDYEVQSSLNGTTWATINDGFSTTPSLPMTNLQASTDYWFRVRGENGGKAGAWSAPLKVRTPAPTVPSVARNVIIDMIGRTGFRVDWDAPSESGGVPMTSFVVELSTDGGSTWAPVPHAASTATSLTVTGLTAATNYQVRVAAINVAGTGPFTAPVTARTADPVAPTVPLNLTVDTITWLGFRVDWDAPASNGDAPITDFTVQVSTNRGVTWTTVPHTASTATSLTVTGLTASTEYRVRVAAVNAAGTGPFTATRTVRTASSTSTRPTSLTSRLTGPTSLTLSWRRPTNLAGQPVTDYLVEVSSNRGVTWAPVPHPPSNSLSMTVNGLTKGVTYQFRVTAITPIGNGAVSSTLTTTVPTTRPDPPTGLTVGDGTLTRTSVQLSWTAPVDTGGRPITDYTIETSRNGGRTWTTLRKPASTARSLTINGLIPNTTYQIRVKAKTSVGTSTTGPAVTITTPT